MAAQQQQQKQQHCALKIDLFTLQTTEIEHAKPGPQSPQLKKDAKRAMAHTDKWQPDLSPCSSPSSPTYRQEDQRHEIMGLGPRPS
ncbi:hypothetical protein F5Y08DRAFT_319610 [Xylaria arbuscula]|nr:hypothetical protein F5Y08DRAFT_319610 [Xylaria arbuscula]